MGERETAVSDASLALPIRGSSDVRRSSKAWPTAQRVIGLFACVALSPMCLVLYPLVRLTSRGPFLFRQVRPGYRAKPFTVFKIRTMRLASEKQTALGVSLADSTVTPVGRVLRRLKIDELPQLWNVARGEMELVGPRPVPLALDETLRSKIEGFCLRYEVKPGLTNVGQVAVLDNELGDGLVRDWNLRVQGELHYIRNKSFAYDVVVIALTFAYVLRRLLARRHPTRLRNTD